MSLFISSLNSGSNGNCYYIGNDTEAVLVDVGISCREIEKRMKRLDLSMEKVKAVFISHEHIDHITGLPALSKKYQVPVYITPLTLLHANMPVEQHLVNGFYHGNPVTIGGLTIHPFSKSHDAADPHSFIISYGNVNIGVFTDIGYCCDNIKKYFRQCHAIFLESNYCANMLEKGSYPWHLKRRISGNQGHLSNTQALDLFLECRTPHLSHLFLSHLSKNNNTPEIVNELFSQHAGETRIVVASRYAETPVFCIDGNFHTVIPEDRKLTIQMGYQLSLFQ